MKKNSTDQIDKDLESLYKSASKHKVECPHCKKDHEIGGDFAEMARAMELRIKYANIKPRGDFGPSGIPAGLQDDK